MESSPQRLIFDTDMGIDDALALLYLLASPEANIDAITTVHGNVPVEQATRNVFEVLAVSGGRAPVIAQGNSSPLRGPYVHAADVHGPDGLGGWTVTRPAASGHVSAQSAVQLILHLARQHPGEMRLLLLGPATNAALAFQKDPESFRQLREIVMMAGAISVPGNTTAVAEFNIYADPEAARTVLRSGVPVTMVGLDVTRQVALTREILDAALVGRHDTCAEFLRCLLTQGFSFYKQNAGWEGMYLHDPLAAAVLLDSSLVGTRRMQVDIETTGELTRGMLVADRRPWKTGIENANVCESVDSAHFLALFCARVLQTNNSLTARYP